MKRDTPPGATSDDRLTRAEVKDRASAGVFFIASAGVLLLVVGFVGNLVLARLLTPEDFGILALGMIVITLATTLADGGLAAAMIRREQAPTEAELRSLTGLQLLITTALVAVSVAVALNFGESGRIAAVMTLALPLSTFQIAGRVMIIRNLEFWRTTTTDSISQVAFYAWSIVAAMLGAGAWSMATGVVVRSIVATGLIIALSPTGLTLPAAPRVRRLLPEIRFGIRFQLMGIAGIARDQLLNLATATIAGVAALGSWTLTTRLMQAPGLLFQSMWQVGYPAMAHLLADNHDPRPILEEGTRITSVAAVLLLAPFATATPVLIEPVFGPEWATVGELLPLSCLALLIFGPISVVATGYLSAANRPGDIVRVITGASVVAVVVAVALLPLWGVVAVGIAYVVNAIVESILLDRYVRRECGARLFGRTILPLAVGTIASLAALVVRHAIAEPWLAAVATASVALGLATLGLALVCRPDLVATIRLCRTSMQAALGRRRDHDPEEPPPLPETPGLLIEP